MLIKNFDDRQQRVIQKQNLILGFLRDETWSSAAVLATLLGMSHSATHKTLCQLRSNNLLIDASISPFPFRMWGITPHGLAFAWVDDEAPVARPVFEPSKLSPMSVQHHLDLQVARLRATAAGWTKWTPGERLGSGWAKRPDAIIDLPGDVRIAVELERTIKTAKRYQVIFSAYLQMIRRGELAAVHYVCPNSQFAMRLNRMFGLIQDIPVFGQKVVISEKHRAKLPVYALANWPPAVEEEKPHG
jgi:hypothetical protein